MNSDREKQFAKNTVVLSIGTIGSKIFTFLLLPLYTSVLTTEDYGNVDVLQSVIQLAIPIITLQLGVSVFRYLIEKQELSDKREIVSSALVVVLINTVIAVGLSFIVHLFYPIQYFGLFILCIICSTIYVIAQNVVRGFGHNGLYSFCGFVAVLTSLLINVILIVGFGIKGASILIALAGSNIIATIIIITKERLWKFISISCFSYRSLKELLKYSLPLIPNEISWWIANTSDRFLILSFWGSGFNGIYAAANKLPNIYTTFHNVFNLAWIESISRAVNDSDRDDFINSMIDKCYRFFCCICIGIISCISIFFRFLVGQAFSDAYPHAYILTLAIFVNSMCAIYGGIFTAFKESKTIGTTTVIGAITNIIINFVFIRIIGLYAASLSTLVSYLVIYFIRVYKVGKLVKLKWPTAFLIRAMLILSVVSIGYFIRNDFFNIGILVCLVIWSYLENKKTINGLKNMVQKRIHGN